MGSVRLVIIKLMYSVESGTYLLFVLLDRMLLMTHLMNDSSQFIILNPFLIFSVSLCGARSLGFIGIQTSFLLCLVRDNLSLCNSKCRGGNFYVGRYNGRADKVG